MSEQADTKSIVVQFGVAANIDGPFSENLQIASILSADSLEEGLKPLPGIYGIVDRNNMPLGILEVHQDGGSTYECVMDWMIEDLEHNPEARTSLSYGAQPLEAAQG